VAVFDTGLITMTVNAAAATFTRSSGSFLTDGFAVGMPVAMSGFATAGNNGAITTSGGVNREISVLTATVLTARANTSMADEGPVANTRVVSFDAKLEVANGAQGVAMLAFMRQNVRPGYARNLHAPCDPLNLYTASWAQIQPAAGGLSTRATEGLDGVNFGLGTLGVNRRTDLGSPTQPCQIQHGPGRVLTLIPVTAGNRVIQMDVRYWPDSGAGRRPRLVLLRDLDMGVADDETSEAGPQSGTAFGTITLSFTVPVDGVVALYREQQDQRADAYTFWDNLQVN